MSKTILLVLTVGLVCGLVGLAYADNTAEITITATVGTTASLSPLTTSYTFTGDLEYGTTYHVAHALIFTNDGKVSEYFEVTFDTSTNWNYDTADGDMDAVPDTEDEAKIGSSWTTKEEVRSMQLINNATAGNANLKILDVSKGVSKSLWLGIWTPALLSSSSNATGEVKLIVTATME